MSGRHEKRYNMAIGILFSVFISFTSVRPFEDKISLSEIILQLSGARGAFALGFSMTELMELVLRYTPIFLIILKIGSGFFSYFKTASVYVFSRCPNRKNWYRKNVVQIFLDAFLFEVSYCGGVILLSVVRQIIIFSSEDILTVGYHVLLHSLWIVLFGLLMGLLAIKLESSMAFMVVMGIQSACIAALSLVTVMETGQVGREPITWFVYGNPIAHTVLAWHQECWKHIESMQRFTPIPLGMSVAGFVVCLVGLILAGEKVVMRTEIGIQEGQR